MAETVGLIGVGLLGTALAERLLRAGSAVVGYDVDESRRQSLASAGGKPVLSAGDVADRSRTIVFCLPNSKVVQEVVDEILPSLVPQALIIDTTTGDPVATGRLGDRLAEHEIRYVDATVAGSSQMVRDGEVLVMAGGQQQAVLDARSVLDQFAKATFHVGPCGSGARMKLVFNLVLGLHRAVLAEGLSFAAACGVDPQAALDILRAGLAYSRVMDVKGPKMLAGDFTPQARLSQHLKDVRLILDEGSRCSAKLPLSMLHRSLLEKAEALGYGADDNSAIMRAFAPDNPVPQTSSNRPS